MSHHSEIMTLAGSALLMPDLAEVIVQYQSNGHKLAIISGRSYRRLYALCQQSGIWPDMLFPDLGTERFLKEPMAAHNGHEVSYEKQISSPLFLDRNWCMSGLPDLLSIYGVVQSHEASNPPQYLRKFSYTLLPSRITNPVVVQRLVKMAMRLQNVTGKALVTPRDEDRSAVNVDILAPDGGWDGIWANLKNQGFHVLTFYNSCAARAIPAKALFTQGDSPNIFLGSTNELVSLWRKLELI
jgi:hypothetical protein